MKRAPKAKAAETLLRQAEETLELARDCLAEKGMPQEAGRTVEIAAEVSELLTKVRRPR